MDDRELQRRLQGLGLYAGPLDGAIGPLSLTAINAYLNFGQVAVPQSWPKARRILAAKQLLCRDEGIEVGPIDGLPGPQTEFAFAVYAHRHLGGPDPTVRQRTARGPAPSFASNWPRQRDVPSFFGAVGGGQVNLNLPYTMKLSWDLSKNINRIKIHEKVHDSAFRCLERIAQHYNATERADKGLDLFGGCFEVRRMRGSDAWSMHSWGIAIDFDPVRNGLHSNRTNARLAQRDCDKFWEIWEAEGWLSLGRARNFDWMHVQAALL